MTNKSRYYTRNHHPAPDVTDVPVNEAEFPRLFKLGEHAASATEIGLEMIVPFDYNKVGMKAYLDRLGFTFIFLRHGKRVYVAVRGDSLIGDSDREIINGLVKGIRDYQ